MRKQREAITELGLPPVQGVLRKNTDSAPGVTVKSDVRDTLPVPQPRIPTEAVEMPEVKGLTLVGKLGRGGMANVYEAIHDITGQRAAVKVIHEGGKQEWLYREQEALCRMVHPGIPRPIYDTRGMKILVMNLIEGRSVGNLLDTENGPLPLARCLDICLWTAHALSHAHARGIVHRDISCGNILVGADNHVTLLDFGICHIEGELPIEKVGEIIGTPRYMAPEMVLGRTLTDPRLDLFSLGIVFFIMLSGYHPFHGARQLSVLDSLSSNVSDPPLVLPNEIPSLVSEIVYTLLEKDPQDRYHSAAHLVDELIRVQKELFAV